MAGLKDKVVLVVGGGRGLGRATARRVAKEGAKLVLVARTAEELSEAAEEVRQAGAEVISITADVTREDDLTRVTAESRDAFGDVDVVVNCAGGSLLKDLRDTTVDEWEEAVAANLKAVFLVMREFLPPMMDRGSGQIINLSSRVGVFLNAPAGVYGSAKAAVVYFSRAWAAEAKKRGVKVLAIAPGPMDTPMRWAATPDFARERTMSADTIADFICWVISHPEVTFEDAPIPVSIHY